MNWQNGFAEHIKDYHTELFISARTDVEDVLEYVSTKITDAQNTQLLLPIMKEEVRFALFQMHPDKAPGQDGMTLAFCKKNWSIVGDDIVDLSRKFFEASEILVG